MTLTPLINFDDAVTAANLNPNQTNAVFYTDGLFANRTAVAARCPHAKLFGITVWGETGPGIFALDCETGNLGAKNNAELIEIADAWVAKQISLGVELICVYANLNLWENGLLTALAKYGHRIKRWVADYNGIAAIPAWADADQFADPNVDHKGVDENVALATFFGAAVPAPAPADPFHYDWFYTGPFLSKLWGNLNERKVVEQYDGARKHSVKYAAYLLLLRAKLNFLAKRVASEAGAGTKHTTWGEFRRGWRFQALIHRAQGQQIVK